MFDSVGRSPPCRARGGLRAAAATRAWRMRHETPGSPLDPSPGGRGKKAGLPIGEEVGAGMEAVLVSMERCLTLGPSPGGRGKKTRFEPIKRTSMLANPSPSGRGVGVRERRRLYGRRPHLGGDAELCRRGRAAPRPAGAPRYLEPPAFLLGASPLLVRSFLVPSADPLPSTPEPCPALVVPSSELAI